MSQESERRTDGRDPQCGLYSWETDRTSDTNNTIPPIHKTLLRHGPRTVYLALRKT